MATGLRRRERVLVVTENGDDPGLRHALARAGGDPERLVDEGRLAFLRVAELYLAGGGFDAGRTLARWQEEIRRALELGFAGARITATTGWVFAGDRADAFHPYGCACEGAFPSLPAAALCQYDRSHLAVPAGRRAALGHAVVHDAPLLTVERRPDGRVAVSGELDLTTAPVLRDVLESLERRPREIDLSGLAFLDLAGLRALRARGPVALVAPSQPARAVIDLLGEGSARGG